jgi:hypothetical protein
VGDVLDVDPSVGVRLTQYALGVESDESQGYDAYPTRFYGELGLNVKSDLNRVYEWSEDSRIKHSIVPEINLRYIPDVFQSDHNFFGDPEPFRYFRELQAVDDTDADWRNGGAAFSLIITIGLLVNSLWTLRSPIKFCVET